MLRKRGPWSVRLYWVKGHTGQDYKDWGLTEEQEKGNRAADQAALHAREFQSEDLRALASWAETKHRAYEEIAKEYDNLAVQTIMESTRREKSRDDQGQQEGTLGTKKVRVQKVEYHLQGGRKCCTTSGQRPGKPAEGAAWDTFVPYFICMNYWVDNAQGCGITWLELLMYFENTMNVCVKVPNKMEEETSVDALIKVFKKRMMQVIKANLVPEDADLFRPNEGGGRGSSKQASER